MRKYTISVLVALLITLQSFAASTLSSVTSSDDDLSLKQCETVAKACLSAGFERSGAPGKAFWHDCMKPALLGQTVTGVNIDSKDVVACRKFKIAKMQKELKELQQAH
jgi:hypothetical protein